VYAGPPVDAAEIASIESQARYITRPVWAMDALHRLDDGSLVLQTPPDPRTGVTSIELDPLEWIHRITSHIPDPGKHCQRSYGAHSNRGRIRVAPAEDETASVPAAKLPERDNSDCSREARTTWAWLIKKVFEADPLLCKCGARMRIVSFITDPRVVDRIRHLKSPRSNAQDPFEPRAPPPAVADRTPLARDAAASIAQPLRRQGTAAIFARKEAVGPDACMKTDRRPPTAGHGELIFLRGPLKAAIKI
jgi:hypothetical protein